MAELDRRSIWTMGYPVETSYLDLEIYRLVAIFGAAPTLAQRDRFDWSWLKRYYEFPEACRILVSLAALLRNQMDSSPATTEEALSKHGSSVGVLTPSVRTPTKACPLAFREACNKILHADFINPDVTDAADPENAALNPIVHLYGTLGKADWRASLNIFEFAQCAHALG